MPYRLPTDELAAAFVEGRIPNPAAALAASQLDPAAGEGGEAAAASPPTDQLQGGAVVARLAHNQEADGAIPSPATSGEDGESPAATGESPVNPGLTANAGGEHAQVEANSGEASYAASPALRLARDEPPPQPGMFKNRNGSWRQPGCQKPDACAGTWRARCYSCERAFGVDHSEPEAAA
jgi:hypothetical protein